MDLQSKLAGIPLESIIGAVIALMIVGLCFFIFFRTYGIWYMNYLRQQGKDPLKQKSTLFDVRDSLVKGQKDIAVRIYRQIFKVDQKEAQQAVDELEKNMHQKG